MVDQNSQFYAILTNVGAAKQANADALGIAWKITQMGVGDANGADPTPNATQNSLINEWRRAPLNQLKVDDNDASIIVAEQVIPADIGGKWIREIGLYDADGDLVAVANCAPTYKPVLSQGSGRTQVLRMSLVVSNAANVQLKIDPSVVLATREWVTEELARQDFKHSVLVATTTNIILSGLQTIDGVALTAGARVLVKNQITAKDNGLYEVVSGAAWTRCADANSSAKVTPGLLVLVEKGTANSDSAWQLVTDAPITLGVTALSFEMAFGRTGVAAGTYRSVQVDKYGRVVAATNPSTVAGYGITDVYTKSETYNRTETSQAIKTAVDDAINGLVASAPGALDTLDELAAALGDDANFAGTMVNKLAEKAPLASPKFTGTPEVPTPSVGSSGLQAANMSALATAVAAASRSFRAAVIGVSTNVTLTASQAGNAVQFNTGPLTLTLPAVADVGIGASFMLRNPSTTATQTLNVASSGQLVDAGSTVASIAIKPVEWLEVAASGTSWFVVGRGKLKEVAELDSPTFTGNVGVPTRATTDRSANAASTQFVANLLASLGWGTTDLADLPNGIDLNTQNMGGAFQVNSSVNAPPGFPTGVLFVVGSNSQSYTHQLFYPQTLNKVFHRCSYGATNGVTNWRDWDENPDLSTVKALLLASRRFFSGSVVGISSAKSLTAAQSGYAFNVTAAVTLTLPAAVDVGSGGTYTIRNVSSGNVTIAPASGSIYVKGTTASSLVLSPSEWVDVQASDTNYVVVMRGKLGEVAETESPSFTNEVKVKGGNVLRLTNNAGTFSVIGRVDDGSFYLLVTDPGNPDGSFNTLRPIQMEMATGLIRLANGSTVGAPSDDDNSTRVVNSAWVKRKFDAAAPVGQVAHFALSSPPSGWLKRNGAAVSRTTYAALYAEIGTKFGAGDGSTTFNLPDDRELIDRAWTDGLNAADAGRALFSAQAGQLESHVHTGTTNGGGSHSHTTPMPRERILADYTPTGGNAVFGDQQSDGTQSLGTSLAPNHTHGFTTDATGGTETRMANRAYLACIKY